MIILLISIFLVGYLAIIFEQSIKINKAAIALITAVLCWTVFVFFSKDTIVTINILSIHLSKISEVVFFLLGAMTIVELIDAHDGFQIIVERIKTTNKTKLIWIISITTFFLSAVLDNLTTAIVMLSILSKLVADKKTKHLLLGLVIIAANAGGAWSPIGDVTTTMLWIGGQITPMQIVQQTFLASFVCMAIPTLIVYFIIKETIVLIPKTNNIFSTTALERNSIFFLGLGCLLFVPIFKAITGLPPYMGMMLCLAILWVLTEIIHRGKHDSEKGALSVNGALKKIDTASILFFFGILLSIAALDSSGILIQLATSLNEMVGNIHVIAFGIGLLSAIFDNVPLVASLQSMYSLDTYPTDHYFWELLAYATGTGGSCLIIGSAAGIAIMGIEKIDFFWYLKRVSWIALVGFISGMAVFMLEQYLVAL